jgi:TolB-like protein/DNA-binding winged helix-turn-helix (wHTH) protein
MSGPIFELGEFTLDSGRFELCCNGRALALERKPMELLILLAERQGQLVSRNEISQRLWAREVFVDTEHGINTAVRKIRQALGDDPERPRFVQTVTGKGYRLVGPVIIRATEAQPEQAPSVAVNDNGATFAGEFPAPLAQATDVSIERRVLDRDGRPRWWVRRSLWLAVVGGMVTVAALLATLTGWKRMAERRLHTPTKIRSVAVLPLENLSGDPGQEYFADGMTDELITMLARDSTLRIVSRTSVMQYKGARRPVGEIARALDVDGILEGSIARSSDQVHMTVQLIDADRDTHVWAESYVRSVRDSSSLPGDVAQTIARRLHQTVAPSAPARSIDPEAHDAYMRGRYLWFGLHYDEAAKYFRKATEIQPDYALGWAGVSMCYSASTMDWVHDPRTSLPQSDESAAKALQLDPSLPEANLAMGAALFLHRWDWEGADQQVRRAIELDPRYAEAYHLRARILTALNRNAEAIEVQKKEMDLDPFARPWGLAYTFYVARQYDAAIDEARLQLENDPHDQSLLDLVANSYRCKGMDKEAADGLVNKSVAKGDPQSAAAIRRAYQRGGYKAVVRWQLSEYETLAQAQYLSPVALASLHAQLGQRDQALALLEEAYRQRSPQVLWIQTDPAYDFLHADERYRALIQKIGLPPAY